MKLVEEENSGMGQEMRFLVTQSCNYQCTFCHKEGLQSQKEEKLSPTDYGFLFAVGKKYLGINSVTFTGGEPLFRRDIMDIANAVHSEGALITLTTNGFLLSHRKEIGKYLNKVNLSLHSLDPDKYESVVGQQKGALSMMMESVERFRNQYLNVAFVLNTAVVDGVNTDNEDYENLIRFSEQIGASVKFIELFPAQAESFVPLDDVRLRLSRLNFVPAQSTSRKTNFTNGVITASLTRILCSQAAMSENPGAFCHSNNDLFVSPDGSIKLCREKDQEINLYSAIVNQDTDSLVVRIQQAFDLLGKNCVYNDSRGEKNVC